MDGAGAHGVLGPAEALSRIDGELDLDDEHGDGEVVSEQEDDEVCAVLGRLDLGEVDRGDACSGVWRERHAEHLDEELCGERRTVLEEIDEDLMGHGGHRAVARRRLSSRSARGSTAKVCFANPSRVPAEERVSALREERIQNIDAAEQK
ncbi:hypothetical protein [Sorangium sp. So ce1000]|uniref:hypothetical protein n=1 Tax=Sorangium sp. So ce1000 TaxID=3133325 RepID=UPI003F643348